MVSAKELVKLGQYLRSGSGHISSDPKRFEARSAAVRKLRASLSKRIGTPRNCLSLRRTLDQVALAQIAGSTERRTSRLDQLEMLGPAAPARAAAAPPRSDRSMPKALLRDFESGRNTISKRL
jgi:hypothetical protein